jgi:rhodanese-related sulfurtransferase
MKNRAAFVLISIFLSTTLLLAPTACNLSEIKTSDADVHLIQTEELKGFLDGKKGDVVLLDVRPAAKFQKGRIPSAVNIPLPELAANDSRLAQAKHLVVYAAGWTDILSRAAAKRLLALGYKNVHDYRGGLEQWKLDAGSIEGNPSPTPEPLGAQ